MARNFLPSTTTAKTSNLHGYFLPKGVVTLEIMWYRGQYKMTVKETHIVADPDHQYFLQYVPHGLWADDITVEFGDHGFLRRIHTQVEDQLDDVLEKALGVVTGLVQIGAGMMPSRERTRSAGDQPVIVFEGTIDPFDEKHVELVNHHLNAFAGKGQVDEEGESEEETEKVATFSAEVCGKPREGVEVPTNRSSRSGVYVKPRAVTEIALSYGRGLITRQIEMPHPHVLEFIEIPAANFVKTTFEMKFDECGYPSSIHINQPSSIAALGGLILMPINAILSLPAKIFKFRIDIDQARTSAIESQYEHARSKAYYEAQMQAVAQGNYGIPSTLPSSSLNGGGYEPVTGIEPGGGGVGMAQPGAGASAFSSGSSGGGGSWQEQIERLQGQEAKLTEENKLLTDRIVEMRGRNIPEVTPADRDDEGNIDA